jgi:hypothetical protein
MARIAGGGTTTLSGLPDWQPAVIKIIKKKGRKTAQQIGGSGTCHAMPDIVGFGKR